MEERIIFIKKNILKINVTMFHGQKDGIVILIQNILSIFTKAKN